MTRGHLEENIKTNGVNNESSSLPLSLPRVITSAIEHVAILSYLTYLQSMKKIELLIVGVTEQVRKYFYFFFADLLYIFFIFYILCFLSLFSLRFLSCQIPICHFCNAFHITLYIL